MVSAGGDLAWAEPPADPALSWRDQTVLSQGAPWRMAAQPAWVTIEDVALFTHDRGLLGYLLTQLTAQSSCFALLVTVNDTLQDTILGETTKAPLIQNQAAMALWAGEAGIAWHRCQ